LTGYPDFEGGATPLADEEIPCPEGGETSVDYSLTASLGVASDTNIALYGLIEAGGEISEVPSSRNPITVDDGATIDEVNFDLSSASGPGTGEDGTLYVQAFGLAAYTGVVVTMATSTSPTSGETGEAIHCGIADGSVGSTEGYMVPWDGGFSIECPTPETATPHVFTSEVYFIESTIFPDMSPSSLPLGCTETEIMVSGDTSLTLPEYGTCDS
jgi:hypothetical protein